MKNESHNIAPEEKTSRWSLMVRALRHRNYRFYLSGQLISIIGSWMTMVATGWLVWSLTQSPLMLGAVGFASQIPAFLLGPIAGVMVDRCSRHRLLVLTQFLSMVQIFILAFLAITGLIVMWHIIVLMSLQGFIKAFDIPARQAFVVELVETKDDLANAIALNSSVFNAARTVGPAIGGALIVLVGPAWCFLLDGISFIGVIASLLMIKVPPLEMEKRKNPFYQFRDGYKYAIGFPPIRALLLLVAGVSLVGMPYSVLLPAVASDILHGGSGLYGALMAVSGLGALAGALVLASRESVRGLGKVISWCTLGFGLSLIIFSHSSLVWISLGAIFVMGYTLMLQNAAANTILQTIVEPDKRGRVMSFYVMAFMGMMPLGSLWGGALADRIGTQNTLLICGLGCVCISAWFARMLPKLTPHVRPIYQQMGIIPKAVESEN